MYWSPHNYVFGGEYIAGIFSVGANFGGFRASPTEIKTLIEDLKLALLAIYWLKN